MSKCRAASLHQLGSKGSAPETQWRCPCGKRSILTKFWGKDDAVLGLNSYLISLAITYILHRYQMYHIDVALLRLRTDKKHGVALFNAAFRCIKLEMRVDRSGPPYARFVWFLSWFGLPGPENVTRRGVYTAGTRLAVLATGTRRTWPIGQGCPSQP